MFVEKSKYILVGRFNFVFGMSGRGVSIIESVELITVIGYIF